MTVKAAVALHDAFPGTVLYGVVLGFRLRPRLRKATCLRSFGDASGYGADLAATPGSVWRDEVRIGSELKERKMIPDLTVDAGTTSEPIGTIHDTAAEFVRLHASRDDIDFSIVVPCYNEEKNIPGTLANITEALTGLPLKYEIIVVDDGSRDKTSEAAAEYVKTYGDERIRVYRNHRNMGLARVYVTGAFLARGKYYRIVCGDNVEAPQQLREIFSHIGEADMIIPYHVTVINKHPLRRLVSKGFTLAINIITGHNLRYYNGMPILRRLDVLLWPPETTSFSFQAETIIRMLSMGATYVEIKSLSIERENGDSTAVSAHNILSGFYTLFRLFCRRVAHWMKLNKGFRILE